MSRTFAIVSSPDSAARRAVGSGLRRALALSLISVLVAGSGCKTKTLQQEIDDIERHVDHEFAGPVAKALALLQFVDPVHKNEENLAAVLHPSVDTQNLLSRVSEAVEALIEALAGEGLQALPIFVSSLKDPVSAATVESLFAGCRPDVVINATGFAVSSPGGERKATVLESTGAMVLQAIFSGST